MVTASRRKVVTQATEEEEMMEVTATRHHLLVAGVVTKTLMTLPAPGTRVKKMMTRSQKRSTVIEG